MYVDGFVLPVETARKDDYLRVAREAAAILMEFGATPVVETWADDVSKGKCTSLPRAIELEDYETCVISSIEYPDRPAQDAVNNKVFEDPRMEAMILDGPISGQRKIFGGFGIIHDDRDET